MSARHDRKYSGGPKAAIRKRCQGTTTKGLIRKATRQAGHGGIVGQQKGSTVTPAPMPLYEFIVKNKGTRKTMIVAASDETDACNVAVTFGLAKSIDKLIVIDPQDFRP